MTVSVSRAVVEAFYRAYASRDIATIRHLLARRRRMDHQRAGRHLAVLRHPSRQGGGARTGRPAWSRKFFALCFVTQAMLSGRRPGGDAQPPHARRRSDDGRVISFRLAHFLRFRDDKLISNLSLIDSFDAVEQVLGHPLAVPEAASTKPIWSPSEPG